MDERRPFEVFSVKIKAERGQQYCIDITISENGIPVFTEDSKPLGAKVGYGLIGINNKNIVGKTIESINKKLLKCGKSYNVVTFTMVTKESLGHPSMGELNKVRKST